MHWPSRDQVVQIVSFIPSVSRVGTPADMARASFGLYNTREEVDALVEGIQKVREVFA